MSTVPVPTPHVERRERSLPAWLAASAEATGAPISTAATSAPMRVALLPISLNRRRAPTVTPLRRFARL